MAKWRRRERDPESLETLVGLALVIVATIGVAALCGAALWAIGQLVYWMLQVAP